MDQKLFKQRKLMHGKTSKIKSKKIGILKNLPNTFEATRYHSLIIDKKTLIKRARDYSRDRRWDYNGCST